jgi:DNA-binding NarL/FixJ family response regulator
MATSCLIVDDNATYTTALRIQFERDGISVVGVASTVDDALRLIEEHRPDVALVDIRLGTENGIECAQRLANAVAPRRPFVILISAYQHPDAVMAAAAAFAFLPKSDLSVGAVDELLTRDRGGDT